MEEKDMTKAQISIHAPTRGATRKDASGRWYYTDFNPRSHEGSDGIAWENMKKLIHYFNPRSHEGSDQITQSMPSVFLNFNPRSHEGSDNYSDALKTTLDNFNPRSHEGSDSSICSFVYFLIISIHAPTRGATENSQKQVTRCCISIHAPTRGATAIFAKKFSFLSAKIV